MKNSKMNKTEIEQQVAYLERQLADRRSITKQDVGRIALTIVFACLIWGLIVGLIAGLTAIFDI